MFTQNEIENAISCVQKENIKFKKICYNEDNSNRILAEFKETDINSENLIVISSSFKKNNILHKKYIWILSCQNVADNWKIIESYDLEQ